MVVTGNIEADSHTDSEAVQPQLVREVEFSNKLSTANEIEVNKAYVGNLDNGSDVDYYAFTLPSAGSIKVSVNHDLIDDSRIFWEVQVLDASGEVSLLSMNVLGKPPSATSPKIRLPKGTYHLRVAPRSHSQIDYHIVVHYDEEGVGFEKEFNNSYKTATLIETNQLITGNLHNSSDVDFIRST